MSASRRMAANRRAPFATNNWPGPGWRPFAPTSPFNKPIPANPTIHSNSTNIKNRMIGFGTPGALQFNLSATQYDYHQPTYYSQPTDPVVTINCTGIGGGGCQSGFTGTQVRIPSGAVPSGWPAGTDRHMTIVDEYNNRMISVWNCQQAPASGTIEVGGGGSTPLNGDGRAGHAKALGCANLCGLIRLEEMEAGVINHPLVCVITCTNNTNVYPANGSSSGRACSSIGQSNTDAPAMGQHFQLNYTPAEIDALGFPGWKRIILKAMAKYGFFVCDTGGGWWSQCESGSTYTAMGVTDKWATWAAGTGDFFTYQESTAGNRTVYQTNDRLDTGVDWNGRLRVLDPTVSQNSPPG